MKRCHVEPPTQTDESVGTTVTIRDPSRAAQSLLNEDVARAKLTAVFALRLLQTPDLTIEYQSVPLDPQSVQSDLQQFELEVPGLDEPVLLDVIEWTVDVDRALHLCDPDGFSLHSIPPGIQAPAFNFTAYVRWNGFRELEGVLSAGELSDDLAPVIHAAQDRLREHFRARAEQRDTEVIRQWKQQGVYPYIVKETDESVEAESVEAAGREVFDLVALTVNASSPGFARSDADNKKVTLRLLREAVEHSPESVHKILQEVAKLDAARLQELAELLENTPLARVIGATRRVTDRLDFLHALDLLLFDFTDEVTERDHLHKILERELWMFGDHFDSAISERGLTKVLTEHLKILGRSELVSEPVRLEDGKLARVDLMFSAQVAGRGNRRAEHLVVELKAPKKTLTTTEVGQIENYATAVMEDSRFHNDQTYWEFWLVGNEVDGTVQRRQTQPDRQPGLIDHGDNYRMWVFEWSQILEDHRRRLLFMREALEHQASDEASMEYLRRTHAKYLPPSIIEPGSH